MIGPIVLERRLEVLVTGSIYRRCTTEHRKANVSFSLNKQNAPSVGGWLQTEISKPHLLLRGRKAKIKREAGKQ